MASRALLRPMRTANRITTAEIPRQSASRVPSKGRSSTTVSAVPPAASTTASSVMPSTAPNTRRPYQPPFWVCGEAQNRFTSILHPPHVFPHYTPPAEKRKAAAKSSP